MDFSIEKWLFGPKPRQEKSKSPFYRGNKNPALS